MPVIEQKTTNKNKVDFDLNRLDKSKTTIFSKYPKFFAKGLEKRIVNSGKTVYNNRKAAEDLRCPARFGRAGAWLRIFRRHRIVYMPHLIRRSSP